MCNLEQMLKIPSARLEAATADLILTSPIFTAPPNPFALLTLSISLTTPHRMDSIGFLTSAPSTFLVGSGLHARRALCNTHSRPATHAIRMMADDKPKNPLSGLGASGQLFSVLHFHLEQMFTCSLSNSPLPLFLAMFNHAYAHTMHAIKVWATSWTQ